MSTSSTLRAFNRSKEQLPMILNAGEKVFFGTLSDHTLQGGRFEGRFSRLPKDGYFSFRICLDYDKEIEGTARIVATPKEGSVAFIYDGMNEVSYHRLQKILDKKSRVARY